jgi:hypothetical protein
MLASMMALRVSCAPPRLRPAMSRLRVDQSIDYINSAALATDRAHRAGPALPAPLHRGPAENRARRAGHHVSDTRAGTESPLPVEWLTAGSVEKRAAARLVGRGVSHGE